MSFRLALVTLVFNDRKSLSILLRRMAELYRREDITLRVVAIDDGSTRRNAPLDVGKAGLSCICRFDILRVATTNLRHQRGNRDRAHAARRPVGRRSRAGD